MPALHLITHANGVHLIQTVSLKTNSTAQCTGLVTKCLKTGIRGRKVFNCLTCTVDGCFLPDAASSADRISPTSTKRHTRMHARTHACTHAHTHTCLTMALCPGLPVAWHSGTTSVSGRQTFPVLCSTSSWWVTTNVGKPSARSANLANSSLSSFLGR